MCSLDFGEIACNKYPVLLLLLLLCRSEILNTKNDYLVLHLKINNAEIPKVTATKFLGIVIDDRLNWKPHIQSVKSKLSSILSIMYKASKLITTAGMYTLYCSLFQP